MDRYLLVFLGGGLGAMARFALGSFVARVYASTFPWGTFLINVSGSLAIGFLMALFQKPASTAGELEIAVGNGNFGRLYHVFQLRMGGAHGD